MHLKNCFIVENRQKRSHKEGEQMFRKSILLLFLGFTLLTAEGILPKRAPITHIEISGVDDADKLMSIIGMKEGDIYTPDKARYAKDAIIKAMETKGYYGTVVDLTVKPVNDSVALDFRVNRGEKIKIKRVVFTGNEKVSSSDLEENLVNKEGGWLSFIPFLGSGGVAMPEQLPYDQMRVKEAYMQRGYLDATVSEPLMKVDFSSYEAEVTYVIHEGERYTVSAVSIEDNIPNLDKKKVYEELKLKKGKIFNVKTLRSDMKRLQEMVGDLGYAFAKIDPIFKKDPKNHTVSITYKIDSSKKVYINDVIISGNTKTMDYVVRRYIYLAPGDLFSYTDLEDTKKELQKTGFFDKVVVKPQRISEDKINIVVEVEEAQTGSISGGFGYGSYDGFMVSGSISDRNLFGSGIAGSLTLDFSGKSHNYSLSFTDPRVWDSLFSLSFGIYDQEDEYDYDDSDNYTVQRKGGWFSFGRRISRTMHATIGYSYTDVEYSDYEDIVDHPETYESYKKSSLLASFTYDSTDDYYVPREGIYAKIDLDSANLGGDTDFIKAQLKFAAYYGMEDMIDYDLILRYKLKAGYIDDGGYTPLAEMFYLGGSREGVRGFSPGSISPFYKSGGDKVRVGGDQIFVNSIEASIPLEVITKGMRLTGFVDYGMIKNTIYDNAANDIQRGWIDRASAGAQIEWKSPFGPINLVFAYPLNDKDGDDTSVFEFTMGSKF